MPFRILVVDDNELNLSLIAKILGMDGYEVILAGSGEKALQSAMQSMPDLAVLDIMMPDMNGFDLCRRLRQPPLNAKGPIVMLTAMSSESEKKESLEAGANEIWSKPFDMELFRRRIGELLGSSGRT
jgi:DNA-binding response OmpR family regulator